MGWNLLLDAINLSRRSLMLAKLDHFELEDFFARYEHRSNLLNLGSSDALPWPSKHITEAIANIDRLLSFDYPNPANVTATINQTVGKRADDSVGTAGAAEALFLALASERRANHPTTVGIPSTSYGAYNGICQILDFATVTYSGPWPFSHDHTELDLESVCAHCDVVIVNNPHNPSGTLFPKERLINLATSLEKEGKTLIVDEVFCYPEESLAGVNPAVVIVSSLSKLFGLPGLRFGWLIGNEDRIQRARTIQQYTTLSLNSTSALVGCWALSHLDALSRKKHIEINRETLCRWGEKHSSRLKLSTPEAGTTVIFRTNSTLPEAEQFQAFVNSGVLVVPGSQCFDSPDGLPWFRLGYGRASTEFTHGLERIIQTINSL